MKLVHKSLTLCISAVCAAFAAIHPPAIAQSVENKPYIAYYNPGDGFKPAQRDFTKIFLQLAGSLEHHGSPEPYIRHVIAEHERIAKKYKAATGKNTTARPKYLKDEFVENLLKNWNKLSTGLKLESLSRQSGRNMRLAIMGTWNMSVSEMVSFESQLTPGEAAAYRNLISKTYFTRTDLPITEKFYASPAYDKLTETGKNFLTKRTARGIMSPDERNRNIQDDKGGSLVVKLLNSHHEQLMHYMVTDGKKLVNADSLIAILKGGLKLDQDTIKLDGLSEHERDALQFSHAIKADFVKRFQYIRQTVKSQDEAEGTVRAIYAMVDNLAVIAHSEFEAGLLELRAN
jgi:hypothetical protein